MRGRTVTPLADQGGMPYALPAPPHAAAAEEARQRARLHAVGLIDALCDLLTASTPVPGPPPVAPTYYSMQAAADVLGVDPATVSRWVAAGQLPAWRAGRITRVRRSDLDALGTAPAAPREGR